jgi:asparagine synthase (glutamine-hydrolysing)
LLANHLGFKLLISSERLNIVDVRKSTAGHLPRPTSRSFAQSGDQIALDYAASVGATAMFSGGGGDNVFCYLPSASPVADSLRVHGLGAAARTAVNVAQMSGGSWPEAFSKGLRRAWLRPARYEWSFDDSFLTREAREMAKNQPTHPWLQTPAGALPGKATQIAYLIGIENHLEGFGRELVHPFVPPLMSRPLVETCLRIPSWMWCANGVNRSVARVAFREHLPPQIIARRSKGTPDGFVARLYHTNRATVREMLLDGHLRKNRILETGTLEDAFAKNDDVRGLSIFRLMALADVEAWLQCQIG